MANKKGSDGRYRYRVCIGKDETGKPKYKSFYVCVVCVISCRSSTNRLIP